MERLTTPTFAAKTMDMADAAACGIVEINANGEVLAANLTALQWLERDASEIIQSAGTPPPFSSFARLKDEDDVHLFKAFVAQTLSGLNPHPIKLRLHQRSDSYITAQLLAATNATRSAVQTAHITIIDISADHNLAHELKSRLTFLQGIVDRTPSRLAYYDLNLICKFSNQTHASEHGRVPGGMLGLHISEIVSPAVLPEILPKIARALCGETLNFEAERLSRSGEPRFFSIRYLPDFDGHNVVGLFVELNDITDRRRTEDYVYSANIDLEEKYAEKTSQLNRAEQRFWALADGVKEYCVFFLNPKGQITEWGQSGFRVFGHISDQMLGHGLTKLLAIHAPSDEQVDATKLLVDSLAHGHAEAEGWGVRANGTRFWMRCVYSLISDNSGLPQAITCIIRDMTESRILADFLRTQNKSLPEQIQEHAQNLTKINQDFESFSYLVGHDLRAPLRHIVSYSYIAKETAILKEHSATLKHIESIEKSAVKMGKMVDALLEYARLGKVVPATSPVDIGQLMRGMIGHIRSKTPSRLITWTVGKDLPTVRGDAMLLAEAIGKLLDNAVKFTEKLPQAQIEIGLHATSQDRCVIYIKDNGAGFDSTKAQSLFLLFQRQHHSMDFPGLGASLAIAQRIIEKHDGLIRCEASPNMGCTFYIDLPIWNSFATW